MPGEPPHLLISNAKELVAIALDSEEGRKTLLSIASDCENIRLQSTDTNPVNLERLVQDFVNAMSTDAAYPVIIADSAVTNSLGGLSKANGTLGRGVYSRGFEILINRPVCITLRRSVLS